MDYLSGRKYSIHNSRESYERIRLSELSELSDLLGARIERIEEKLQKQAPQNDPLSEQQKKKLYEQAQAILKETLPKEYTKIAADQMENAATKNLQALTKFSEKIQNRLNDEISALGRRANLNLG
ncbi:MAG: hypothetical protein AAF569_06350, partial [Pseudomonadota bacterium]